MAEVLYKLYYLAYNNYYEQISRLEDYLSEYEDYVVYTSNPVNFFYNDGVDTYIDINYSLPQADYVVVTTESGQIMSRWFIMEFKRNMQGASKGQYRCLLHRDLVADYRAQILDAVCYVEKGIINDQDTAIFNNEQATYNQIKQSEQLIKDKSECQWIVGYYARKTGDATTNLKGTSIDYNTNITYTVDDINNWEYYKYATQDFIGLPSSIKYNVRVNKLPAGQIDTFYFTDLGNGSIGHYLGNPHTGPAQYTYNSDSAVDSAVNKIKTNYATIRSAAKERVGFHDASEVSTFLSQVGAIVYDSYTSKYYKVAGYTTNAASDLNYSVRTTETLYTTLNTCFTTSGFTTITGRANFNYTVYGAQKYRLTIEEIKLQGTYSYDIPVTRRFTYDAPYDVFAIPYSDTFKFNNITCSKTIAMSVAMGIATDYAGAGTLYDLQLLPYCPFGIDSTTYTSTDAKEYSYIKTTGSNPTNVGVIFNVSSISRQTFTVPLSIPVTDVKVDNETKFCRLVSPDFSSIYEFSPAKNRGVDYIKIDMTLKPFQPYIHLAPNFKGLNGSDFDDAKGLVTTLNYSLPIVTDQWKTYQFQNINYEKIFQNQINFQELKNNYGRIGDIVGAAVGTVGGGIAGYQFGGIGGVVFGGIAAGAAGIADVARNEKMRGAELKYAKEQFELNMQTIQALPNTLSKVDAFNQQNKCWPFVEFYDCTEDEKMALCQKIKFSGMTVNKIGKLGDYTNPWSYPSQAGGDDKWVVVYYPFIKGRLIWLNKDYPKDNNIYDDYHIFAAINNELQRGIYLV